MLHAEHGSVGTVADRSRRVRLLGVLHLVSRLAPLSKSTAKLTFQMTDLNKPNFHHGGGTVDYRGQSEVPCGAFAKGFVGPSPPPGEVHTYEFTVKALGANGAPLASATARRKFPE